MCETFEKYPTSQHHPYPCFNKNLRYHTVIDVFEEESVCIPTRKRLNCLEIVVKKSAARPSLNVMRHCYERCWLWLLL